MKSYRGILGIFALIIIVGGITLFAVTIHASKSMSMSIAGSNTTSTSTQPGVTLSATSTYAVHETNNISYGPLPEETLDLCVPVGKKTPSPGLVMIHAGGWQSGDKETLDGECHTLASQGVVVANINYRLVQGESNTLTLSTSETDYWPDQIVDAQLAVRWLRSKASTYNLSSNEVCSFGESAGAQLAVFLGVLGSNYPGDESSLYPGVSSMVNCVIDNSGPVDLINEASKPHVPGLVFSTTTAALRSASPVFSVSPQSAPMVITQGTQDPVVSPSQAQELVQALQANNVPYKFISYDGGHVFSGLTSGQEHAIIQESLTTAFGFI